MAIIFADPVNQYDTAKLTEWWTQVYAPGVVSSTAPTIGPFGRRPDQQAIRFLTSGAPHTKALAKTLTAVGPRVVQQFAFRQTGPFGTLDMAGLRTSPSWPPLVALSDRVVNSFCSVRRHGRTHLLFRLNHDGTISALGGRVNDTWALLGSTTEALQSGAWYYLEIDALIDDTAGTVSLKVNGDEWLSLADVQTQNSESDAGWNEILIGQLRQGGGGTTTMAWDYCDLVTIDGDDTDANNDVVASLGDVAVSWVPPSADGAMTEWDPLGEGDHFAEVDEVPHDGDASNNQTDTPGAIDTFQTLGVPLPGAAVLAVGVMFSVKRVNSGPSSTQPVLRVGTTNYALGVARGNTSTYTYQAGFATRNPDTTDPWDETAANAAEPGYEKVS